ncbi:MAG: glycosyltransferase family 2 protein [Methylococcales bacterium]|jgi:glycosyltransferase involved in cell wall biosynthesis
MMKTCVIVPVYNHESAIIKVVEKLKLFQLPCILINDGSSLECSLVLQHIAQQESDWITLVERQKNGGKGAAVIDGFKVALTQGFTHAIQIDADGQHKFDDITLFLAASERYPKRLIAGKPHFDLSVPKKRLYGRQFTNLWIGINTLSFAIADGMCGFRCYPLSEVEVLLKTQRIGRRMDFDIDIIVRLYWQGVDIINIETDVQYPMDGVSHFKMWRDNVFISIKHAQLFFGMLLRIPQLVMRESQ